MCLQSLVYRKRAIGYFVRLIESCCLNRAKNILTVALTADTDFYARLVSPKNVAGHREILDKLTNVSFVTESSISSLGS